MTDGIGWVKIIYTNCLRMSNTLIYIKLALKVKSSSGIYLHYDNYLQKRRHFPPPESRTVCCASNSPKSIHPCRLQPNRLRSDTTNCRRRIRSPRETCDAIWPICFDKKNIYKHMLNPSLHLIEHNSINHMYISTNYS